MQIEIIEHLWIPLNDGRRLAARMWKPKGLGPFPAILEYLPYNKRNGTDERDETTHVLFAEHGYICIRVDIAGTGESDGLFDDEYSEQELSDGEEILSWIADLDICGGQVGMIGISWGGFNGLQLAYRQPKSLKAVVSVASTADRYADDIHYMGGCLLTDNASWGEQMSALLSRVPDPELREDWRERWFERMENLPFLTADWLEQNHRNDYWKHGSVCEDYSRINIPVLAITGWSDAYVNTPSQLATNLPSQSKALLGPWEHRYAHLSKISPANFHSEVLNWFDRWLKDIHNDVEKLPTYRAFMQEHRNPGPENQRRAGLWIAEDEWPSPNVTNQTFYPGNGSLNDTRQNGKSLINTSTEVGQASGVFCPGMRIDHEHPGDQSADDALSICFDLLLDEPIEILGRAALNLSFTSDKPVAQIIARLCDVSPEGKSQRITYRAFNLTHSESHETPQALKTGQTYNARIELNETAHFLKPGHKLRLALSNSYWPIVWPAPEPAKIVIDLAETSLELPIRQVTREIHPQAPGAPQLFPTLNSKQVKQPGFSNEETVLKDGWMVKEINDDFGISQNPHHGMELGYSVKAQYIINPDNPADARCNFRWNFTYQRGDWQVRIATESSMSSDTKDFHLHRSVWAFEGDADTEIFNKEWTRTVPRNLL